MTRNREIRLEDLHECDHTPETPISDETGNVTGWVCRCGQSLTVPIPPPVSPVMPVENRLNKLIAEIQAVVPYVTATLGLGNTFEVEKARGGHPDANWKDWRAVHAGRADSSRRQLEHLLKLAQEMKP